MEGHVSRGGEFEFPGVHISGHFHGFHCPEDRPWRGESNREERVQILIQIPGHLYGISGPKVELWAGGEGEALPDRPPWLGHCWPMQSRGRVQCDSRRCHGLDPEEVLQPDRQSGPESAQLMMITSFDSTCKRFIERTRSNLRFSRARGTSARATKAMCWEICSKAHTYSRLECTHRVRQLPVGQMGNIRALHSTLTGGVSLPQI